MGITSSPLKFKKPRPILTDSLRGHMTLVFPLIVDTTWISSKGSMVPTQLLSQPGEGNKEMTGFACWAPKDFVFDSLSLRNLAGTGYDRVIT